MFDATASYTDNDTDTDNHITTDSSTYANNIS